VKTSGLEGKMEVIDLTELVARQIKGQMVGEREQETEEGEQKTENKPSQEDV
jgi:hypothetical protein